MSVRAIADTAERLSWDNDARGPERPLGRSLQGKILLRALLISAIPLLLLGSVMLGSLLGLSNSADRHLKDTRAELSRAVAGRNMRDNATAVANEVERLLAERINDVLDWSRTPTVYYAARTAALNTGNALAGSSTVALEAQYAQDRRLAPTSVSERYLRAATQRQPTFSELFYTERNGFTVAASERTSDFVQDDEEWWDKAWADRLYLGHESSGGLVIAARIDDPETDQRVGVFKATLNLRAFQQIASEVARATGSEVSLLTRDGQLLAETRSEHLDTRILNSGIDLEPAQADIHDAAVDATGPAAVLHDRTVAGLAPLDPADVSPQLERWEVDTDAVDLVAVAEQSSDVAFAPLAGLADVERSVGTTARTSAVLALLALLAALLAAFLVSTRLAEAIVRPLRSLRNTAHDIAERQLPALIDQVQHAESDDDLPAVPSVTLNTDDEVEDVAQAFNVVRATAVTLAAEQARSRRNVSRMFVSLGRRNQSLLSRQLEFIDRLEREESDPERLDSLFKLDHLATRMRRNAESLLVLAGEEPARLWSQPVALGDVVRGAVAEVEDYQRVNLDNLDDAQIVGTAASDVSHLLAELIENALHFSPPDSPVVVVGRRVTDGYSLAIVDDGVGMTPEQLNEVNDRIKTAPLVDRVPSSYLGLFVVGRLATRHDIQVRLVESTTEGVTVKVLLPVTLVDPLPVQRSLGAGAADSALAPAHAIPIAVGAVQGAGSGATPALVGNPSAARAGPDTDVGQEHPSAATIDLPAPGLPRRTSKRPADQGPPDPVGPAEPHTPQPTNGATRSSSGLEMRRRIAKRSEGQPDPTAETPPADHLVLRTRPEAVPGLDEDARTPDEGPQDAQPRAAPAPPADLTAAPLTQAERKARAARERLARFQRAVRQGRAQISDRVVGKDPANGDRTAGGDRRDA